MPEAHCSLGQIPSLVAKTFRVHAAVFEARHADTDSTPLPTSTRCCPLTYAYSVGVFNQEELHYCYGKTWFPRLRASSSYTVQISNSCRLWSHFVSGRGSYHGSEVVPLRALHAIVVPRVPIGVTETRVTT